MRSTRGPGRIGQHLRGEKGRRRRWARRPRRAPRPRGWPHLGRKPRRRRWPSCDEVTGDEEPGRRGRRRPRSHGDPAGLDGGVRDLGVPGRRRTCSRRALVRVVDGLLGGSSRTRPAVGGRNCSGRLGRCSLDGTPRSGQARAVRVTEHRTRSSLSWRDPRSTHVARCEGANAPAIASDQISVSPRDYRLDSATKNRARDPTNALWPGRIAPRGLVGRSGRILSDRSEDPKNRKQGLGA